jgi:transcription termination factor Rho
MPQDVSGVFQRIQQGGGFLRNPDCSYQYGPQDTWVSSQLIKRYGLTDGADVIGSAEQTEKGFQLVTIDSICDLKPEHFKNRIKFDKLVAINPEDRIHLGESGNTSMRIVDLIAPIGKGTRGLIVSPPKSGKTQLLEDMANAIHTSEPEMRVIILLIDERPEEVTHFRRNVQGEVLASSSDQSIESHVYLAELTMAHVRCELECGHDVIVLLDSITRIARAFNIQRSGSRRTMSGGLDARALEIPRRFFGLARNIENGGSVTVIATAQVDTGSRMDGYIYEEFKSTGNSEIFLDRNLAEARIFPAINVLSSGTRREELLYSEEEMQLLNPLRRWMLDYEQKAAMRELIKLINKTLNNSELIAKFQTIVN